MIDKSNEKGRYFYEDYSPYLTEHPENGTVRVPNSRSFEEALPTNDKLFFDFITTCLILDPEERPGAA